MTRILVDTSVWIDALNGVKNKYSTYLSGLLARDSPVVICPLIVQEILQGIKNDEDFKNVKEALSGFEMLFIDPVVAAVGAAQLYRSLRKKGITIRKSNDCLIAFYAIYHETELIHKDKDFDKIARFTSLKIAKIQYA